MTFTARRPVAELVIQRKVGKEFKGGVTPASRFVWGDTYFECLVSYDRGVAVSVCDIFNQSKDVIRQLQPGGQIQVIAGYQDSIMAKPSSMFVGNIDTSYSYRNGSDRVWRIEAIPLSQSLRNGFVPYSVKSATTHQIITTLLGTVGYAALLAPSLQDFIVTDYTTNSPVVEEIKFLIQQASEISGIEYLITTDGLQTFTIIDMTNDRSTPQLRIDLSKDTVNNASPEISSSAPKNNTVTDPDSMDTDGRIGYRLDLPFNPLVTPGGFVEILDPYAGNGVMVASTVEHNIGGTSWSTGVRGRFVGGDIFYAN